MASRRLSETYRQSRDDAASTSFKSKSRVQIQAGPRFVESTKEEEAQRLLRQFDLTARYGPCTGITRKQRWERALKLGLDPPESVLHVLQQIHVNDQEQQSLWFDQT